MRERLLTVAAMRAVDAAAIAAGTPGIALMRAAGEAVADRARALLGPGGRALVLCGPGNNGGDGFVAARLLAQAGHPVTLCLAGERERLSGDVALAAAEWTGPVEPLPPGALPDADLVIDALFGAGLARDLAGDVRALVERVNAGGRPVLAVDVPSGLDGDTGAVRGAAVRARETVTFVALKPGHLLEPGRGLCGRLHVADIGTGEAALAAGLAACGADLDRNSPGLWGAALPLLTAESHKYTRGHALVLSGPATRTGAARLAARAALRVGAGLVTLASPADALAENAAHLTAIMLRPCANADDLDDLLADERLNVVLAGPGLGVGEETRARVAVAAEASRGLVLDADALTSFQGRTGDLVGHVADGEARVVLTPHAGEFARLFADTPAGEPGLDKLGRTRRAAALTGAVVVLKGADTVVAAPDGRAAINDHGTPHLGTAGSGDVLGGLIAGLMAQGMTAFEAAAAGVWMHGDAGLRHGPGLIAEDIPELMPAVLRGLADRAAGNRAGAPLEPLATSEDRGDGMRMMASAALVGLAVTGAGPARAADPWIVRQSPRPVKETIDRLKEVVTEAGFTVVARVPHADAAKAKGLELRPTELLVFGRPEGGTPVMACDQRAGLDLPLKALAWQDAQGKVWLGMLDPGVLKARYDLPASCDAALAAVKGATERIVAGATKE